MRILKTKLIRAFEDSFEDELNSILYNLQYGDKTIFIKDIKYQKTYMAQNDIEYSALIMYEEKIEI